MKVLGTCGVFFMLFMLACGFENVYVSCTAYWLRVTVNRSPHLNYLGPEHYELYLGTNCPATEELFYFYDFLYPVSACGIRTFERPWGLLIESSITYVPANLNVLGYIPISCFVKRKFSLTYLPKQIKYDGNKTSGGRKMHYHLKGKTPGLFQECLLEESKAYKRMILLLNPEKWPITFECPYLRGNRSFIFSYTSIDTFK